MKWSKNELNANLHGNKEKKHRIACGNVIIDGGGGSTRNT